jgi:hypothetical protein
MGGGALIFAPDYLHPMPSYTNLSEAVNLPSGRQAICSAGATPMTLCSRKHAWCMTRVD